MRASGQPPEVPVVVAHRGWGCCPAWLPRRAGPGCDRKAGAGAGGAGARQIYVVPEPTVLAGPVILLCLGTLVLVNLVAAVPGRAAARTPAALALRAE
jgi:hypothetical protein